MNDEKRITSEKETIRFLDQDCEVVERYEVSEEYARENQLIYRKRIKFVTPDGVMHDCADIW